MNRRRFLGLLGLTPPAIAADKRGFWEWFTGLFEPAPAPADELDGFTAADWIAPECLKRLQSQLQFAESVNVDYEREFNISFPNYGKLGETIQVRRPSFWTVEDIGARKAAQRPLYKT